MNNANPNVKRAERPDKTLFKIMMGVFFVFFSLPAFYWAFYNFGEYRRMTTFVQELREKSETYLTPNERQEKKNRILIDISRSDRYKLEMFLSGAGAFVLFGIALLLFRNAWRGRKRKNFYENIDPRTVPLPNTRLEVRYTNYQNILLIGVIAFFGLLTALNFYQTLNRQFSSVREIIVKSAFSLFVLALVLFLTFLMIRAKRQAVRIFDASGITRGDGRQFSWTEFCGVVTQTAKNRFGKRYIWREEIAFSGGETAWIIPNRIKNREEVFTYLDALPRARLKNIA